MSHEVKYFWRKGYKPNQSLSLSIAPLLVRKQMFPIKASPPITISNILTVITVNAVQTILWQKNFCRFSFSFHKIKKFWAKGNPDIFTWIYIYKDSVITTVIIYRCNWSSGCDYWSEWQEKSELLTLVSNLSTPLECCFTGSQSHICLNLKSSQTSSSSSSAS